MSEKFRLGDRVLVDPDATYTGESIDATGNPAPWPVDVEGPSDVLSAIAATLTEGLGGAIPHSPGCGRWARPGVGATPRGPHRCRRRGWRL